MMRSFQLIKIFLKIRSLETVPQMKLMNSVKKEILQISGVSVLKK